MKNLTTYIIEHIIKGHLKKQDVQVNNKLANTAILFDNISKAELLHNFDIKQRLLKHVHNNRNIRECLRDTSIHSLTIVFKDIFLHVFIGRPSFDTVELTFQFTDSKFWPNNWYNMTEYSMEHKTSTRGTTILVKEFYKILFDNIEKI